MGMTAWRHNSLMAALRPGDAAALIAAGTLKRYAAGSVLLHEGEASRYVLVVLSGYVKITAHNAEGEVSLLAIRGAGDLLGELAALDGQPRSATATAAGVVHAVWVSAQAFRAFRARHPEAAEEVSRSAAAKLRSATARRIDLTGVSVKVRVARVLVELAASHGRTTRRGTSLAFPLAQPELAALVGAAERSAHKALTELRAVGWVATGYRSVTILDYISLSELAGWQAG
ncbi:Crp/Fnr family transcriptional regulator [Saccharothrix lopnurensis]|uniref:Crp/Fnr family transcriptional regulator n=1 Tax=Saccharothrix lopnurensis TaxID=1670621 RepID=A0ABW1NX81_9PSEU